MNVKGSVMLKFENRKFQLIHMAASPVAKLTNLFELTQSHNHHTFSLKIFLQLLTLFIEFNGHSLPALHILMTRKTENLYRAVLFSFHELLPNFIPTFAIGDFETAPRNALKELFPSITIIGCWIIPKRYMRKFKNWARQYRTRKIKTLENGLDN